jgi:hypothetical protein
MSKGEEAFSRAAMCAARRRRRRTTRGERSSIGSGIHGCAWPTTIIAESLAADAAPPRPVGMITSGLEAAEAPPER